MCKERAMNFTLVSRIRQRGPSSLCYQNIFRISVSKGNKKLQGASWVAVTHEEIVGDYSIPGIITQYKGLLLSITDYWKPIVERLKLKQNNPGRGLPLRNNVLKAARAADKKLVLVPLLFIFIRIWGTIRFIMFCADKLPTKKEDFTLIHKILLTMQGVGDSVQGFVNCILFCFLTPKVFNHLKESFLQVCCYPGTFARSNRLSVRDISPGADERYESQDTSTRYPDETSPLLYPDETNVFRYGSPIK